MSAHRAQAGIVNPLISSRSKIDSLARIKAAVSLLGRISSDNRKRLCAEEQRGLELLTQTIRAALTYEIENAKTDRKLKLIKLR